MYTDEIFDIVFDRTAALSKSIVKKKKIYRYYIVDTYII